MASSVRFSRSTFLALSLCMTLQTSAWYIPGSETVLSTVSTFKNPKVLATIFLTHLFALYSLPKPEDGYQITDEDYDLMCEAHNLLTWQAYKNMLFLYRKYVIGVAEDLEDEKVETILEDGTISTIYTKKRKRKAFGAFGLLDKHVIKVLEKLAKINGDIENTVKLNNTVASFLP